MGLARTRLSLLGPVRLRSLIVVGVYRSFNGGGRRVVLRRRVSRYLAIVRNEDRSERDRVFQKRRRNDLNTDDFLHDNDSIQCPINVPYHLVKILPMDSIVIDLITDTRDL